MGQRNNGQRTSKPHLRIYLAASQVSTGVITRELCKACLFLSRNTTRNLRILSCIYNICIIRKIFYSINRYDFKMIQTRNRKIFYTTRNFQYLFSTINFPHRKLMFRETEKKKAIQFLSFLSLQNFFTKPIESSKRVIFPFLIELKTFRRKININKKIYK